jgi:ComF family protein
VEWKLPSRVGTPHPPAPAPCGSAAAAACTALAGLAGDLLDLLLPGSCAVCASGCRAALCDACLARCAAPKGPVCLRCGAPFTRASRAGGCGRCARFGRPFAFGAAVGLWRYRGTVRALVHAFKYGGRPDVLQPLGARLAAEVRCAALAAGRPLVVAVPARRASRRRRGYDQGRELAIGLARAASLPFEGGALVRRREGGAQAGSSRARRRVQAAAAFRARPTRVLGRRVLLVDDVLSTGATADACARALLLAGAQRVDVVVLAT